MVWERLHELLSYDPDTGIFRWKISHPRHRADGTAGSFDRDGYLTTRLDKKNYKLHRLAWLYVHGRWPTPWIDHINGDPSDNRITNLREATPGENHRNRRYYGNTSGLKGICWNTRLHKWMAQIKLADRHVYLGLFTSKEAAYRTYCEAAIHHFGEFARLS